MNLYDEFEQLTIIADPEFIADAKRSWADSEMDGDKTTCTKAEFVQFFLRIVSSSFVSFAEKRLWSALIKLTLKNILNPIFVKIGFMHLLQRRQIKFDLQW